MKKSKTPPPKPVYEPIRVPRNTPMALAIAAFSFAGGFAIIWHIWWLAALGLLAVVSTVIYRTNSGDHEYTISAAKLERLEAEAGGHRGYA